VRKGIGVTAYYNENDKFCAEWLRNLIAAGHIAPGDVDERSIEDVRPSDLRGYTQCHFFAGIGVWSYALRLAGWSDDRPVWTGSCPCQPFSAAGKGAGFADERHLWPAWHHLIKECKPAKIFGEQVASKDADAWIDLVHADLEAMGYAFGCVPFPSASIGAPHIRDRNYWVAHSNGQQYKRSAKRTESSRREVLANGRNANWMDYPASARHERTIEDSEAEARDEARLRMPCEGCGQNQCDEPGPTNGFWRSADWLGCADGKWRPVEPGTFPLAHGASARVGRLRAFGNAINAQQAAEFIRAAA
jgi:DNA (cytosine-5)-methyltransferase 1